MHSERTYTDEFFRIFSPFTPNPLCDSSNKLYIAHSRVVRFRFRAYSAEAIIFFIKLRFCFCRHTLSRWFVQIFQTLYVKDADFAVYS